MSINKVVFRDETLIDLSKDTVASDKLLAGYTAHDKAGNQVIGSLATKKFATGTYNFNLTEDCGNTSTKTITYNIPVAYNESVLFEYPFENNSLDDSLIEFDSAQCMPPSSFMVVLNGGDIYSGSNVLVTNGTCVHNLSVGGADNASISVTVDDIYLVVTITTDTGYLASGDLYFTWFAME